MGSLLYRVLAATGLVCAVALASCSKSTANDHAGHAAAPVKDQAGQAQAVSSADEHAGHTAGVPSGYAPIMVDAAQLRAFGLSTAKVEQRHLVRALRTVGIVALDETRTSHVHAHVRGFVESASANFTGKTVKKGEALCGIFSHEVLAAQLELISLVRQKRTLAGSQSGQFLGDASGSWDTLLDAARQRLSVWKVPRGQVDRIERTLEPVRTFTLSAPRAGVIVAKRAFVGAFVEPGTELYVISDLSKLWVQLDVYEADVPYVRLGDTAKLTIEGVSEAVTGTISYLAPTIDEATRTLKARLDVDNAAGMLRPGAFVNAELSLMVGHGLVLPESAVIRTGTRNIVFVVHGGEHIQPREVKLGPLVEGAYRVDAGVTAGEEVATGAQFLIDSESRLRATSSPGGGHAGH
jgi:Cu(I)/Ag(I) efflux system membrane fusion protein